MNRFANFLSRVRATEPGNTTNARAHTESCTGLLDKALRSLRRRDRRIVDLKAMLRASRQDRDACNAKLASQAEIIAGLEQVLMDTSAAGPDETTARRLRGLERDLAATRELVESLTDEIEYWRRRAVHNAA